ncbi:hypothetical protein QBC47DRAFT_413347 [Echria macrotheca]|uniref:Uncharacterized protein n=1 Tax=Echria macrotheca TaxID=438768 RepID=A0AAJ0BC85_9PEZI|nr:hypothetical protein QBC47DRAFT_413347 [Echria macrotheca]
MPGVPSSPEDNGKKHYDELLAVISRERTTQPANWTTRWASDLHNPIPSVSVPIRIIAYVPVLFAVACTAWAAAAPPTLFNTRHFVIIFGVLASWVVSRLSGSGLSWLFRNDLQRHPSAPRQASRERRRLAYVTLVTVKNVILGLVPPLLLITLTCGVFNYCYSWAPIIGLNRSGLVYGNVELDSAEDFDWNNNVLYPRLVGACLLVQLVGYLSAVEGGMRLWVKFGGKRVNI